MAITTEQRDKLFAALEVKAQEWAETERRAKQAFIDSVTAARKAKQETRTQFVKALADDAEGLTKLDQILPKSKRGRKGQSADEIVAGLADVLAVDL